MRYPRESMTQNTVVIMWTVLILIAAAAFYFSLFVRYEHTEKTPPSVLRELFPESEKSDISPPVIRDIPSAVVGEGSAEDYTSEEAVPSPLPSAF